MTTTLNTTGSSTITLTGSTCYQTSPCVYTINSLGTSPTISYTGTNSYWTGTNSSITNGNGTPMITAVAGEDIVRVEEKATLEVKGKVKINGEDLEERLERIEQVLSIPTRDVTMEDKHPKLRKIYEEYMRELAKYKTWDRIKGEE